MLRIASLAQHNQLLNNILDSQKRLADGQIQVATGQVSQSYSGLAQQTTRLLDLERNRAQTGQYIKNNDIVTSRLERMDAAVSGMFDVASRLRALLVQKLSDSTGTAGALSTEAQHMLDTVAGLMNTNEDGRFLFAGSNTSVPPVTVPVPDPTSFGTLDSNYYQGDNVELTARAADNLVVQYGMAGDRTGFQNLIAGLKGTIQGDVTNNTNLLETSLGQIDQAITDLADFRNEIGSRLAVLDDTNKRHQDFTVYLENQISDIENVDVTQVMIRLSADQTVLEASFQSVARLSRLTLSQFLR